MASRIKDIEFGSVTVLDFAYWINERHKIYLLKEAGELKSWTKDKILQQYKFTNAFRQLDKGTVALRNMLKGQIYSPLIFFNIVWYRLFNWHEHAKNLGWCSNFTMLETYIRKCHRTHKKIFTGAHMTTGVAFEDKHESYLRACVEAWNRRHEYAKMILEYNAQEKNAMQNVFQILLGLYMVGKFIAYELVCDFRFTPLLANAKDKLTWANMGPGAQRGLKRLGLPYKNQQQGLSSMLVLYERLIDGELIDHNVAEHLPFHDFHPESPFELREIEHSLCEFDKYQRAKRGEGRPRSKYDGGRE
jgi:hypothetical protein